MRGKDNKNNFKITTNIQRNRTKIFQKKTQSLSSYLQYAGYQRTKRFYNITAKADKKNELFQNYKNEKNHPASQILGMPECYRITNIRDTHLTKIRDTQ